MDVNHACLGIDFDRYKSKKVNEKKRRPTNCESCVHYDYDEDTDAYVCQMDLDEDERAQFVQGQTARCPYYRFYDEYKSVQKQN